MVRAGFSSHLSNDMMRNLSDLVHEAREHEAFVKLKVTQLAYDGICFVKLKGMMG